MSLFKKKKVFVGMSGGVDSSVAALLLKKRGFDVYGGFIRGYNVDGCQDRDLEDARAVAQHLNIPFHVFDFEDEYKKRVVDYMLDGYRRGITPNPDVVCNSQIKFGLFYERAMGMGADCVATGHYARRRREFLNPKSKVLMQAKDKNKDQTYFLWQVPRERFKKILFPLGKLTKPEVRELAKKAGLPTAAKKDSQGICFLGKFNFDEFLREHIKPKKGDILDATDKKVGEHDGVWYYTIGQGHGFTNTAGKKFYVVKKEAEDNRLIVAYEGGSELKSNSVDLTAFNFLDSKTEEKFKAEEEISVCARVRYRQPLFKAVLKKTGEKEGNLRALEKTGLFPASGQSVVFYGRRGKVLGGGIIA